MNLLLNNLFYLNKFYKIEIVLSSNFACTVSKLTIDMQVYIYKVEIFKYHFFSYPLFIFLFLQFIYFTNT